MAATPSTQHIVERLCDVVGVHLTMKALPIGVCPLFRQLVKSIVIYNVCYCNLTSGMTSGQTSKVLGHLFVWTCSFTEFIKCLVKV